MFTNDAKKSGGSANVDDLINLMPVQLFMPFIDSLDDKSIYSKAVTNVGVTLGREGAVFNGSATLKTQSILQFGQKFTIECIFTPRAITEYAYVFCNKSTTQGIIYTLINNGKLQINWGVVEYIGNILINETYHVAVVNDSNEISIYINGTLVKRQKNTFAVDNTIFCIASRYDDAEKFIGEINGIKLTAKALEPSKFSLLRPMQLKYPNFKVGNREYVYKDGIKNPDYQITKNINVIENADSMQINANGLVSIENLPIEKNKSIFFEFTVAGTSDIVIFNGNNYSVSTKETHLMHTKASAYNAQNYGGIYIYSSIMSVGASGSGNFRIKSIWVE